MKVHRYQVDVMWLFLAMLGGWATARTKQQFEPQPARQDRVFEQTYSPNQIRPPPLSE